MDLAPLLKTFARDILPRAQRPVVLVVAGGASDADIRLLNELVDAYGVRAHTRLHPNFMARLKPDLLAGADMLVAVRQHAGDLWPEPARSAGRRLPVVASRFDGYKDLVEHGVDGFLVDTGWCEADPLDECLTSWIRTSRSWCRHRASPSTSAACRLHPALVPTRRGARDGRRGREKVDREYRFSA